MKSKRQHKYHLITSSLRRKTVGDEGTSWMVKMFILKLAQADETGVRSLHLQASNGYIADTLCNSPLSQCVWILQSFLRSLNYF